MPEVRFDDLLHIAVVLKAAHQAPEQGGITVKTVRVEVTKTNILTLINLNH